jgi:hypothetical protein
MRPIIACSDHVELRSEPLDEIWWQGRQWAVTSYGLECRDGTYAIEAHRLWERGCGDWPWPMQISGKGWEDIHDFCTAFIIALSLHPRPAKSKAFRPTELRQACAKAIRNAQRSREHSPQDRLLTIDLLRAELENNSK